MTTTVTIEPKTHYIAVTHENKVNGGEWERIGLTVLAKNYKQEFHVWENNRIVIEEIPSSIAKIGEDADLDSKSLEIIGRIRRLKEYKLNETI